MSTTQQPADAPTDGQFEKRVELLEKNDDEQIARGAVLVPDRLDHQGDFLRADTIADLRDSFAERVDEGDAYPGVMHSVFPRDDLELVEDRQLESAETIGGKELPAGTWLQGWKYADDTLWTLVDDGVLGGFSIGGTAKGVIYEPGAMPDDVEIPDPVQAELDELDLDRDDIRVREITEGRIMETSTVDRPAVPDAVHAETKALAKAAPALTENVVAARLYLEARGHEPDDARRLAEYLNDSKSRKGLFGRLRDKWLPGGSGRSQTAETSAVDPRGEAQHSDERAESRVGSEKDTSVLEHMNEDELNEKLEALDSRLDDIDEKLSEDAADDGSDAGQEKKTDNGSGDGPSTEEKVDQLAEATTTVAEQIERVAEQVDQMASAQGVSQQADTGRGAGNTEDKVWGENSPFGGGD